MEYANTNIKYDLDDSNYTLYKIGELAEHLSLMSEYYVKILNYMTSRAVKESDLTPKFVNLANSVANIPHLIGESFYSVVSSDAEQLLAVSYCNDKFEFWY